MSSRYFIGEHKDFTIVKKSSSGGAFTAILQAWFTQNSYAHVCGSIMDRPLHVRHVFADKLEDCIPMRGSKYIASDLDGSYEKTNQYLLSGHSVLFSGTPCQIYGLISQLNKRGIDTTKLLTVEVICHGVADTKFFCDYISHMEKKYHGKAISCNFRAKRKQGNIQDMQVVFENGRVYNASSTKYDWFYSLYHNNYIIRPSCYICRFAQPERFADISLGDAWGKNENFGKSLILANTEKGLRVINTISDKMDLREAHPREVDQPALYHPAIKPDNYDEFWQIYNEKGYLAVQKYIGNNTIKGKIKERLAFIANELGIKEVVKSIMTK